MIIEEEISKTRWSKNEFALLHEYWPNIPKIAVLTGRSEIAVKRQGVLQRLYRKQIHARINVVCLKARAKALNWAIENRIKGRLINA